ncbi:MAG: N-formylglutamate amidohydrolase [Bacteroidota bacterium]
MKNKIILHIPHSSTNIPFMEGFVVDEKYLAKEMLKLTDWYTDDLFYSKDDEMIKAEFSRIFCDPERYSDDTQEVMSQYGMGVLYEKSDEGDVIRRVTPKLKERILNDFYWQHHNKLSDAVKKQLFFFGKALIMDCHSFPSNHLKRDLDKNSNRPDFNIGTDSFHTPKYLIDLSTTFFENAGYTLGIDWPYKGSIVPFEHYNKNKSVQTIMLEINRALYLKEQTNEKSERYLEIKKVTADFIKTIKNSL